MKPSERRALEAEKRARQAAEWREKELEKAAKKEAKKEGRVYQPPKEPTDTERVDTNAPYTKLPEEEIDVKGDGYHRESFWSNHVHLIAFIVSTVVVLFVIGPLGYDIYLNVSDYLEGKGDIEGKLMTESELLALADKGESLTWRELEAYEHTTMSGGEVIEIYIDDLDLTLRAIRTDKNAKPDIVTLIHYGNGTRVEDIRFTKREDIESFIDSPTAGILSGEDGEFDGEPLTKKKLLALSKMGAQVTWKTLEVYKHTTSGGCTVMEIRVSDTDYSIKAMRSKEKPDKINVVLVHNECGEYLEYIQYTVEDVIEEFMDKHTSENETETK